MTADPLAALVQQELSSDPRTAQLVQLLAQREEQLTKELEEQEAEELGRRQEVRQAVELRDETDALHRLVEEMSTDLDALRHVLDDVAEALGACPSCWGDDPGCRWCRGRGHPGFMPPDPEAFERLVLPAVRTHANLHRRPPTAIPAAQP